MLALGVAWLLTHRYRGLSQDARIYAFQALARLHPWLATDLYLQNTTQGEFTVFSPFYASAIHALGLDAAALVLTVTFTLWLFVAAWHLASALFGRDQAWLAVAVLVVAASGYGGSGVFHLFDEYLTARLPAEAMVITALALHFRGFPRLALLIVMAALTVHPLMALPGLLVLCCLSFPPTLSLVLAIFGCLSVLGLALAATTVTAVTKAVSLMDVEWLEVVRERSQFLFLQLWSSRDWALNLRPFLTLALAARAAEDAQIRRLCTGSIIVGVTGLAIAFIAGTVGPVPILLQGQAWRWVWIAGCVSALLVAPTALRLGNDARCGPAVAILLLASWAFSAIDDAVLASAALAVWEARARISERNALYMKWAGFALGVSLLSWDAASILDALHSTSAAGQGAEALHGGGVLHGAGAVSELQLPILMCFYVYWRWLRMSQTVWAPVVASAALAAVSGLMIPATFKKTGTIGSAAEITEFDDWRRMIPPSSNVYVANGLDAASFAWFTLDRPSYLSLDQSAGVVFSRATALEVRRRSEVLLPLMNEDWKLYSKGLQTRSGNSSDRRADGLPRDAHATRGGNVNAWRVTKITAAILARLCEDPALGFLVARENVGSGVPHVHEGPWKDWYLYDCGTVRTRNR